MRMIKIEHPRGIKGKMLGFSHWANFGRQRSAGNINLVSFWLFLILIIISISGYFVYYADPPFYFWLTLRLVHVS